MSIGYEEMTARDAWFGGASISCSICGCVVNEILRGSEDEIQEHLLNAHSLFPVYWDTVPLEIQAEAQAEFGNRWYRTFDYYFNPRSHTYVAIKMPQE